MKVCIMFLLKFLVWVFLNENTVTNINNFMNTTLTGNSLNRDKNEASTITTSSSTDRPDRTNLTTEEPYENMSTSLKHTYFNATAAYNETAENSTDTTNLVPTSSSPMVPIPQHTSKNTYLTDRKRNQLCDCDLTFGSCDVNCCCDLDCSSEDNLTFNQCISTNLPSSLHLNYCIQMSFIYKNNAPFKVTKTSSNLLCIIQDNVEQQYKYRPLSEALTVDDLKYLPTKNCFSWGALNEDFRHWIPKEMKAGSELYIMDNDHQIRVWSFPASLFSAECHARQNVTYLIDQKASCSLAIDLTAPAPCSNIFLKASSYYGFYLLRNPALLNDSAGIQLELCQENVTCILVTPAENYTSLDANDVPGVFQLLDGNLPTPEFEEESGVCHNVVTKVTYHIVHNGTSGLINATVMFQLETIDAKSQYVHQVFETAYIWNKRINTSFVRSGNPGYIVGRPILAGIKTILNTTNEQIDVIEISKDPTKWLTVVKANHNGFCTIFPENRAPVTFRENIMSACIFKFQPQEMQSCDALQNIILTIINGTIQPDSVGFFGNSNDRNVSEWIPIQFLNSPNSKHSDKYLPVCKSIITDLHIDIYHAATGTISAPQQKIFGTIFRYHNLQDIQLNCTNDAVRLCKKEVMLTGSVNFKDISQPAMHVFGQPPSLHASVPADFFYPFTFASQAHFVSNAFLLSLHMLCVITF